MLSAQKLHQHHGLRTFEGNGATGATQLGGLFMDKRAIWLSRRWRSTLAAGLLAVAALLLTGCNNPEAMRQFELLAAQNQAILRAQGVNPHNRLLIQDSDGNIFTTRPDGSERVPLTTDANSQHQYSQPTWSPTGNKIAWSELDIRSGELKSSLMVSQFNGLTRNHFDLPFAPFYLQWSPDESRLAYLSNWLNLDQSTATIALRLINLSAVTNTISTLAQGEPLYLVWSPDSDRILIHIDNDRLEFWDTAGRGSPLNQTFAAFPTPQWSSDGSRLLYAVGAQGAQTLILADAEGNQLQEITDYDQSIAFSLSPDDKRVAYAVTPSNINIAAFGPLYVVDLASNQTREVAAQPVMAFFWSPDGSKLAYLFTDDSGPEVRLRWSVWDGKENKDFASIVPSRLFMEGYLQFFDQYARGMNIWSPDSTAFAYAAVDDQLGSNIWVQRLDAPEPENVSPGVYVAWSPD
jgi:TolB protein